MKIKVIQNNKDEILKLLEKAIDTSLYAVGLEAEGNAKEECNGMGAIDTGRLINSITFAQGNYQGEDSYSDNKGHLFLGGSARNRADKKTVVIGTNVEYAQYVEYGTSKVSPRPFLKNAIKNYQDEYKDLVKQALQNA